jgi:hypothetical protein
MGKVRKLRPGVSPVSRPSFVGDPAQFPATQPERSRRKSKPGYEENKKARSKQSYP